MDHHAKASVGFVHDGFTPKEVDDFQTHFCRLNPWIPFWMGCETLRGFDADSVMPSSTFANTEFYSDWLIPAGAECAAGVKLFGTEDRFAALACHYDARVAERYNRDIPRLLDRLAPAMQASLALNRHTVGGRSKLRKTDDRLLEALALPAIALDRAATPRFANRLGVDAIDRGLPMQDAQGRIRLNEPSDRSRFERILENLCSGAGAGGDVVLRRRDGEAHALLTLLPLSAGALEPMGSLSSLFVPEALALVLVREPGPQFSRPEADTLRKMFGLTAAEARLATKLSTGQTLDLASRELGVAKETARVQLKQIFLKTGTHRQAELVALLAQLNLNTQSPRSE